MAALLSCLQSLKSSKNSHLKSSWHPHKMLLAISANLGAKCWFLCSQLTGMTENLGTISSDHWHLDLTKAEWLLSCYTRKIKHFTSEYPHPVLRIPAIRPLLQKGIHRLRWNIKIFSIRREVKMIYVFFNVIWYQYLVSLFSWLRSVKLIFFQVHEKSLRCRSQST